VGNSNTAASTLTKKVRKRPPAIEDAYFLLSFF